MYQKVETIVLDFDGTISTLRHGWEQVMEPMMVEMICGKTEPTEELRREVAAYIDESTGIQTIHQMKWLARTACEKGLNPDATEDPWFYKAEYNRRLMEQVQQRLDRLEQGIDKPEQYLMKGSLEFVKTLYDQGVKLYVASGTDHADVVKEATALGVAQYFTTISGAQPGSEGCSKEAIIASLLQGLPGERLAVIGDGKVEIRLGREAGARTIGIASDEEKLCGINPVKKQRLEAAGAQMLVGDYEASGPIYTYLGLRTGLQLSFENIRTYDASDRINLVRIDNLKRPGKYEANPWGDEDFKELTQRIQLAKAGGRQIIFSMGAHVIKCGLSPYLIALMKAGYITHLSGNGACSIHDFELAYLGGTSEDVPTAIEDGSFGMWEQTGRWINEALQKGAQEGWGYGESLARYIHENQEKFPYKDDCVLYQAWLLGIPATYHIALGTDIIHQHPIVSFEAIGKCSGIDFKKMCWSVAHMDQGVFMNFGSGVIGPEVFLKSLSIARNLGYPTFMITTANFDLIDLGDYRCKIGYDDPLYYYRPRKNIVNRPVSCGGKGWHFRGDHQETIPALYKLLVGEKQ